MKLKSIVSASRAALLLMICPFAWANGQDTAFDFDLISRELGIELNPDDLQRMREEAIVGFHSYDIYVNTQLLGTEKIEIVPNIKTQSGFNAKIPAKLLQQLSLKHDELSELMKLEPTDLIEISVNICPGLRLSSTRTCRCCI